MALRAKKFGGVSKSLTKNQMILDFGQKNFGPTKCRECSMIYVTGDGEDLKSHQRYHAEFLSQEVRVPRGLKSKILEDYFHGDQVAEISLVDKSSRQFYSKLSALMNQDLGYDRLISAADPDLISLPPHCRTFVYINGKKVAVGCCIAEELTLDSIKERGYQLRRLVGGRRSLLSWRVQNSSEESESFKIADVDVTSSVTTVATSKLNDDMISLPLCGIRRLWVSGRHRRKGYASAMVECVMKNLFYLSEKTRLQVAFAEPTAAGAEFAVKFVGREDFIIY
ncbi:hypothetical protein Aperf_G00000032192 [Anoplocephala perfoliata]